MLVSGCALFDALDTYHYVGIYTAVYKDQGFSDAEKMKKFAAFVEELQSISGQKIEVIQTGYDAIAFVVFPKDAKVGLNRVVISQFQDKELGVSIIKVPAGDDDETLAWKNYVESAYRKVGIAKWSFYMQRSHGQLFNS